MKKHLFVIGNYLMNKASQLSKVSRSMRALPLVALLTAMSFVAATIVRATPLLLQGPEIGKRIGGESSGTGGAPKPRPPYTPRGTGGRGTGSSGGGRSTRTYTPAPAPAAPSQYEVTFITAPPGAEILLRKSDEKTASRIGATDKDGKLMRTLAPGVYNVAILHAKYDWQTKVIQLIPGAETTYRFELKPSDSIGAESSNDAAAATAAANAPIADQPVTANAPGDAAAVPPPAADTADANSSAAEEIIDRYLDPKQSAAVTLSDWQLVQTETAAALNKKPDDAQLKAQLLFARGQVALLGKKYPDAVVAFLGATQTLPTSAVAFYGLGNAYVQTNQPEQAVRAYRSAVKINDEFALAYKGLCDSFTTQGRRKDAGNACEQARKHGFGAPAAVVSTPAPATDSAPAPKAASAPTPRDYLKARRYAQAVEGFNAMIEKNPSAEAYVGLGDAYAGMDKWAKSADAYREAIKLDEKSAEAYYGLGASLMEVNEFAEAKENLERALALDPKGTTINHKTARKLSDEAGSKLRHEQRKSQKKG